MGSTYLLLEGQTFGAAGFDDETQDNDKSGGKCSSTCRASFAVYPRLVIYCNGIELGGTLEVRAAGMIRDRKCSGVMKTLGGQSMKALGCVWGNRKIIEGKYLFGLSARR